MVFQEVYFKSRILHRVAVLVSILIWLYLICIKLGLPSHPQHEIAKRQMKGYSGMVTFFIKGGETEAKKFLSSLKVPLFCVFSVLIVSIKLFYFVFIFFNCIF